MVLLSISHQIALITVLTSVAAHPVTHNALALRADTTPALKQSLDPYHEDVDKTQTHVLMQVSKSAAMPFINPKGELDIFFTQLRGVHEKYSTQAGGPEQLIADSYIFTQKGPGGILTHRWNWRFTLVKRLDARWKDVISAVDVVVPNMDRFKATVGGQEGYKSIDVIIGRIGTPEPETDDKLGYAQLWWGPPNPDAFQSPKEASDNDGGVVPDGFIV